MDEKIRTDTIVRMANQRNIAVGISVVLSVSTILLSAKILLSNERLIVTPVAITESFTAQGDIYSEGYYKQIIPYYASLLLDNNKSNIDGKKEALLTNVTADAYDEVNKIFEMSKSKIRENGASTSFGISEMEITNGGKTVIISGEFSTWLGGKQLSAKSRTFEFNFKVVSGRPLISGFFERKKDESN